MSFFRTQNHAREVEAEEREARRLAHLRESRTARFERLLDPRSHIGADTVALEQQSRVKQLRAEAALEEKRAERLLAVATAEEVSRMEKEGEAARRARALGVAAQLSAQVDARTSRSTWDLEDPLQNRRAAPTRMGLDDPRLGMSSAQVFVGEDVAARQRALLQQQQVRSWTAQMVGEKEARRAADRARDEAAGADMVRYAQMAGEIEAAGVAEQRQRQRSAVLENDALIAEKRAQREREREESKVGVRASVLCSLPFPPRSRAALTPHPPPPPPPPSPQMPQSPPPCAQTSGLLDAATLSRRGGMGLLAEDPADGLLAGGARYRPDYFRGIPAASPQGATSALQQLTAQVEARRAAAAEERARDMALARREAEELRAAGLREREVSEAREAAKRATASVLAAQVELSEERRAREREERKANRIGDQFYSGFGKAF